MRMDKHIVLLDGASLGYIAFASARVDKSYLRYFLVVCGGLFAGIRGRSACFNVKIAAF